MRRLWFTEEELDEIVGACALIEIDTCTPPYLQDFITARLADTNVELSRRVRWLDPNEMHALCEYIKRNTSLVP
jgi:hypothetical protein